MSIFGQNETERLLKQLLATATHFVDLGLSELMSLTTVVKYEQRRQSQLQAQMLGYIKTYYHLNLPPGVVKVRFGPEQFVKGEPGMPDISVFPFTVTLPTLPTPNDVAERAISVQLDGVEIVSHVATPSDTVVTDPLFRAEQNQTLRVELRDTDDNGNVQTTPSVYEAVVLDSTPPAIPGQLGVTIGAEEFGPAPEPTPEPTPEQ